MGRPARHRQYFLAGSMYISVITVWRRQVHFGSGAAPRLPEPTYTCTPLLNIHVSTISQELAFKNQTRYNMVLTKEIPVQVNIPRIRLFCSMAFPCTISGILTIMFCL